MPPQLWQPTNATMMTNDIANTNQDEAVPCFALSKNDSYVMSASGGRISLFNMMTFKVSVKMSGSFFLQSSTSFVSVFSLITKEAHRPKGIMLGEQTTQEVSLRITEFMTP